MLYGLYLSAAGLAVQQHRQNVLANNLANSETTGFKRDLAGVQARLSPRAEYPGLSQQLPNPVPGSTLNTGIFLARTATDYSQGTLKTTNNPTDLALNGPGFFALQGDNGNGTGQKPLLTRDGRFLLDSSNRLIAATSGRPVLSAAGGPITLDPAAPLDIGPTGEIRQHNTVVAQLALYSPAPEHLAKLGTNTFATDTLTPAPASTSIQQRVLETSTTEPLYELTQMLEGQRIFEANAKLIQYQDQTLSQLNTVGRIA